ncbi:class I SAM-dependent methyltransferase [Microbacterium sp. LRZ72]|uniref:DUF7059 domain-containing protein n=1 Tax=Microbacterium sp. LRZ72 TaxID=2942481 RepID=UPI0029B05394|nr:methyltransferase [Microbacterium sp. LRZ72]MDX2376224.1 class I SAM-dependent methyltransferase [Microbacterium sp. LRZ72]
MISEPRADLCAALAADLTGLSYTSARLRALWGVPADAALGRGSAHPARAALHASNDPVALVARLFWLGDPVPADALAPVMPRTGIDGLGQLGLVESDGELVRPRAMIRPQAYVDDAGTGEWWIASDLDELALGGSLPPDHVLGVGGASMTLAGLQVPVPGGSVLDLGAGCGIQALRARRAAASVLATDVSLAALRYTRFNALLNGVDGIDVRHGSLYEPVAGERFDRIVSNPPFVITPRKEGVPAYEYRDGGLVGDALVQQVVADAGRHLTAGGIAQLLGNWEYRDDEDGLDRVRRWVGESAAAASGVELDAWVIERERLDPAAYAEMWIRDGGTVPGSPAFDELLGAWLRDFADRGVSEVGFGYILLRRSVAGNPPLSRYERIAHPIAERGLGAHLAAALAAHDRQAALDDDELATTRLRVADDVTEARHHLPGAADPSVIELRQGGGFARTVTADTGLAALVGSCDGDLDVGTLVDAIAHLLEVDAADLRRELLPRVRELLVDGILSFVE